MPVNFIILLNIQVFWFPAGQGLKKGDDSTVSSMLSGLETRSLGLGLETRPLGLGLNFYFICITDIITKQYNNSEIHVQTLYKWDSEGSQMTYLNLYPKHVERHSVR